MGHLMLWFAAAILLPIALGLFLDAVPVVCERVIAYAAGRTYQSVRDANREDWLAGFAEFHTKAGQLRWAVECVVASFRIEPPFGQRYRRWALGFYSRGFVQASNYFQTNVLEKNRSYKWQKYIALFACLSVVSQFKRSKDAWVEHNAKDLPTHNRDEVVQRFRAFLQTFDIKQLKICAYIQARFEKMGISLD